MPDDENDFAPLDELPPEKVAAVPAQVEKTPPAAFQDDDFARAAASIDADSGENGRYPPALTPNRHAGSHSARPARVAEGGRMPQNESRTAPHNIDAEQGLLAAILIDEGLDVIEGCIRAHVTPDYFYRGAHQVIFAAMLALHAKGTPVDELILSNELVARGELSAIGGLAFLYELTNRIETTVHAKEWRSIVMEQYFFRQVIRISQRAVEQAHNATHGDAAELLACVRQEFEQVRALVAGNGHIMGDMFDSEYQKDNPDNLLGDDFVEKGGSLIEISMAGVGKSSFLFQQALTWARGLPFMGIRPVRKLRTLIVQAEDSNRYKAKCAEALRQAWNLTPGEVAELRDMVKVVRIKGVTGEPFLQQVRALAKKHKADLVAINPISNYIEGDCSRAEVATPFFNGLDRANAEDEWAWILIHHTAKPPKQDGNSDNSQDWSSIYMGFGSSVFANRPRAAILIQPRPDNPGEFIMRLGKGGRNAGVTKEVAHGVGTRLEPTLEVPLRYTTKKLKMPWGEAPMFFWEPSEMVEAEKVSRRREADPARSGKYDYEQIVACFPEQAKAMSAAQVYKVVLETFLGMSRSTFDAIKAELLATGRIRTQGEGRELLFFRG